MPEEWRPVVGYAGFYEVSNEGQVRSLDREFIRADGQFQRRRGRILIPGMSGRERNYPSVLLRLGRRQTVHVLVCEAFHGPKPSPEHEVAHGNGVSTDNRASNLRWATPVENQADSRRHGTFRPIKGEPGEGNSNARLTWSQVQEMRARWLRGETQASLATAYGIGKSQVHNIVRGKQWAPLPEWRPRPVNAERIG